MVRVSYYVTGLMAAFAIAAPSPLVSRADEVPSIGHDKVKGFAESAPAVVLKFKPYLKIASGCVPWPAVNDKGEVSGGLKNTGPPNGKCEHNKGQVYTRTKKYANSMAIMYAWYMPKDQPAHSATGSGHRHEWENTVVWVSDDSEDAKLLGIAWSKHGGYGHARAEDLDDSNLSDGHPLIEYFTNGFTNHELTSTSRKGGQQPAIDWDELPEVSRDALNRADFKSANVPFKDDNYINNLRKASLD